MLVGGKTTLAKTTDIYWHVVCEYADANYVEFVTAYIPAEQEWAQPPLRRRQPKRRSPMAPTPAPMCREHHVMKAWQPTTFEYQEEGITVRVPNLYAWVCPVDGEASFTPETVDELLLTIRELLTTAKRARERRLALTEYIVSVG